ncbi:GNAT family N-acetyltransferase [Bosea sp. 117]|uniref:GNAT family N-acetyltransferase n=1 Tax=Bosea sp. 117 TaxID=1125973 RepID=UPI0004941FD0|nr:GNAT family N-acetyltransferase [Bosea sp. 117]
MSASAPITTRWATPAEMQARAEDWRALAAEAIEPNVFAEPDYVLPALRHLGANGLRFLLAERDGVLAGLLPLHFSRARWGVPLACAIHHLPYAPHGTPLIADDDAPAICGALLDALALARPRPVALLMPFVPTEGRFTEAWQAALAARRRPAVIFDPVDRPALHLPEGAARLEAFEHSLSRNRRKRLAQQRRRLEQHGGALQACVATGPEDISAALQGFLDIEATGWKGRRGTAVEQDSRIAAFFRESVAALAISGQARIVRLEQSAGPVAAAILLASGSRVWFYKTAFDGRLAAFSPGALLDMEVTRVILDDPSITLADSLTTVPDSDFGNVWRDRLPMADLLVGLAPASSTGFTLATGMEHAGRHGRALAKAGVQWLRERRGLRN